MTAIAAGRYHTCALTSSGGVECWGWNRWGQLGDGTSGNLRFTPVGVIGFGTAKTTLAIVSGSVAVTRAGRAPLALRCGGEAGCEGTLTLSVTVSGKLVGSSARRVRIKAGDYRFSFAAGLTHTAQVDLTTRALKLLTRAKRLPASTRTTYEQPDGATTTATHTITLSLRR